MASSSDIFQKVMEEIFQNIEGLVIECDDMIMFAEMMTNLLKLLNRYLKDAVSVMLSLIRKRLNSVYEK